eukprot:g63665.t1
MLSCFHCQVAVIGLDLDVIDISIGNVNILNIMHTVIQIVLFPLYRVPMDRSKASSSCFDMLAVWLSRAPMDRSKGSSSCFDMLADVGAASGAGLCSAIMSFYILPAAGTRFAAVTIFRNLKDM